VETDETEGLAEDSTAGEESGGETEADGHKRKRRRRRRGRPGEAREDGPARDDNFVPHAAPIPVEISGGEDSESDEDESEEQSGQARTDQGGERRPRRRGRRGGRRRRGLEDGQAGSIVDELNPASTSEATSAVADFDGTASEPYLPVVQPESIAPPPEQQPAVRTLSEPIASSTEVETAQEAERAAARRRSTVREKVSFLTQADAPAPVSPSQPAPAASPAPAQPEPEATGDGQPRRAGWWSRRFGNGE
jgi:ribonuclease E